MFIDLQKQSGIFSSLLHTSRSTEAFSDHRDELPRISGTSIKTLRYDS